MSEFPGWPREASRSVKAAITARFGKGWSVVCEKRAYLFIQGPKDADGYGSIPDEHRAALGAALGCESVPKGGVTVSCVDWERFVEMLLKDKEPAP